MEIISKEEYIKAIKEYVRTLNNSKNFIRNNSLIEINSDGNILIIGDLHGDIKALNKIFNRIKIEDFLSNEKNILISLGDLIDRGENGVEIIYELANLGIKYPGQVIILRGNHEITEPEEVFPFTFNIELYRKYGNFGKILLEHTIEFFNNLPLAAYISKQIFLVHGGVPIQIPSLEEISVAKPNDEIGLQLRWNDPTEDIEFYYPSERGVGYKFGFKITENFLIKNNLRRIIRSHQVPENGYILNHNKKIITIFSAKNVYGLKKASYSIYFSKENKLKIKIF